MKKSAGGGGKLPADKSSGAAKKKRATALSPQRLDPLWKILDHKVGGRDGLLAAAVASTNPKARDLAALILDTAHRSWGTKALAKKVGLTAPEVVDMFRDRKWLEATLAIHEDLPDILRDAAIDAKASFVPCPECKGKGGECYLCKEGKVRRPGDKDKLKFVGEAAGLIGKTEPLIQNNTQVNVNQAAPTVSFEDLLRKATITINKPKQLPSAEEAETVNE